MYPFPLARNWSLGLELNQLCSAYETPALPVSFPAIKNLVVSEGIEPSSVANQATVLPLNELTTEIWWTMAESNPQLPGASGMFSH